MPGLPEGAFTTSIDGSQCTIFPQHTGPAGNFNISSHCNTPPTLVVLDSHSTTRPTVVREAEVSSVMFRATLAPGFAAENVDSSATSPSTPASSEVSGSKSKLPSELATPSSVSPPPSPGGPPAPSFITISSTSTIIPISISSTSTTSHTTSTISSPPVQQPAQTQTISSPRKSQQIQAPAEQAPVPPPRPQTPAPDSSRERPNDQEDESLLPVSQKTPDNLKDNAALARPTSSTPSANAPAPAGNPGPSSPVAVVPLAQNTLDTSASSPASSTKVDTQSTSLSVLRSSSAAAISSSSPLPTTTDPSFNNRPSKIKPISEVPGGPVTTKPTVGTADTSSTRGSSPPTAMIVGLAVGGAAVVGLVAMLIWFWRRRATKKDKDGEVRSIRSPGPGNSGVSPSPLRAYISNGAVGWLPSRRGQRRTLSSDLNANRFNSDGRAIPTMMAERDARPGYLTGLLAPAPSSRPAYAGQGRHSRSQTNPGPISPGLDLDLEGIGGFDPFSDSNAISQSSAPLPAASYAGRPGANGTPYAPARGNDNADVGPAIPSRSHVRSMSATARTSQRPPFPVAPVPRRHSVNRESVQSVDSFTNRRNKFRSDPFDLEIESCLIPSGSKVPDMPRNTMASSTYSRPSSRSSSKYTSGVPSISDWSLMRTSGGGVPAPLAIPATIVDTGRDSPTLHPQTKPGDRTRMPTRTDGPTVVFGQAL